MAIPMDSIVSMDGENPKNVDGKQLAPAAGKEVRRSMLQVARKSLAEAPRASKMSMHTSKMSIKPELEKNDDVQLDGGGESEDEVDDASSKGMEFNNVVHSPLEEHCKSLQEEAKEAKFNPFYRLHLIGFFKRLLDRLSIFMQLPEALNIAESHIDLEKIPGEQKNLATKKKLLASANLINYTLPHPIRISKFEKEAKWLQDVLEKALHEVVEADITREKRLLEAIESEKDLKLKTQVVRYTMKMEAVKHLERKREWTQNLVKHKRELREMCQEQKRQYKYKAELALAAGDMARRNREIKLQKARERNVELMANMEREKLVHKAVMEYMGKQNMLSQQEIVNLNDNLENDNQCMDWAIERIEAQIKMKNLQINDIQPQYDAEMEAIAKAEAEAKRKHNEWYANLGFSELSLKSAYKIQKIWRGYLVRRIYGKILKKLRKKRLAAINKGKKE